MVQILSLPSAGQQWISFRILMRIPSDCIILHHFQQELRLSDSHPISPIIVVIKSCVLRKAHQKTVNKYEYLSFTHSTH